MPVAARMSPLGDSQRQGQLFADFHRSRERPGFGIPMDLPLPDPAQLAARDPQVARHVRPGSSDLPREGPNRQAQHLERIRIRKRRSRLGPRSGARPRAAPPAVLGNSPTWLTPYRPASPDAGRHLDRAQGMPREPLAQQRARRPVSRRDARRNSNMRMRAPCRFAVGALADHTKNMHGHVTKPHGILRETLTEDASGVPTPRGCGVHIPRRPRIRQRT